MIRTILTSSTQTISFAIPKNYVYFALNIYKYKYLGIYLDKIGEFIIKLSGNTPILYN